MKAIFSKSGNKKDISGKMDRRGVISSSQPGGVNPSTNLTQVSMSQQQNGRGVSSFIPTSAIYHNHANANGHHVKPLQTVSMQQQSHHQQQQLNLPQHMNGHGGIPVQHHSNPAVANTYYSNIPPGSNYTSQGTLGTRQEQHYTNYSLHNQQNFHHSQPQQQSQQIHQRTLTKTYSSSHNQQSHYGSTTATGHANNNANQSAYYGNGANLVNGGVIMNGGGHHSGGERSAIGNHQNPSVIMMNQIQHTYSHQQVNHQHQSQSQSQSQSQQQLQRNAHLQQPLHQQYQLPSTNHINHHNSNNNSSSSLENLDATEGLPSTLVESMRTLFDILDDTKQGKIRLSDIETRWESDSNGSNGKTSGAEPLIKMGVLEYLRKVTPADGLLTFDRFCSGLRLALLTTNSNDSGDGLPLHVAGHHKLDNKFPNSHNLNSPPQQYFHEQVKNLTHSVKSIQSGPPPPAPPPAYGTTSNNPPMMQLQSKSISAGILPSATGLPVQSNTMSRMSKIPNLSASRLPMPGGMSSGIPTSPNSRTNGNFSGTNGHPTPTGITNSNKNMPLQNVNNHSNNTYGGTTKRISEQGTTVALVHPQPPPNPKPISAGNIHQHNTFSNGSGNGTLKLPKQISTPGLHNRYASRNSSLDDLKASANVESSLFMGTKERPPSAPILDNGDGDTNHHQRTNNNANNENDFNVPNNKQKLRERAKSQERDRGNNANNNSNTYIMNSSNGNSSSRADEKTNFAKSRQRTHSMPQLQLNKLKSKSSAVVNFDDSPMEILTRSPALDNSNISSNNISTPGTNYSRPSVLKNGSKIATSPGGGGSSIPTTKIAQQISTNSLKHLSRNEKAFNAKNSFLDATINGTSNDKEANNNEFIPPPPKPPRNATSGPGPVTISTTLVNGVMHDPPLSGSSFGSGQTQSSSATISLSASSSSGTSSTRPEIRNVLHSWQKSMVDKKPVEATLSVGSIASNHSSITVKDTNANTTNLTVVPPLVNGDRVNTTENNSSTNQKNTNSDEVKLRTKSNLRRKETARRHTVQSGIDFSTLKRLKQLEQERDVLQQGLSFLNKANEWYSKQLEIADDKIGLLSKGAPTADFWSESHEERLNLLGCRVSEVNSLLTALMDGSSRLPLHMNLQIPTHLSLRTITRLKDQNRQLTHEVSDYSHRVTQLENEKALLLRQLFHQKKSASDETVYM